MFLNTLKIFSVVAIVLAASTSGIPIAMPYSSTGTGTAGDVTPESVSIDPVITETVPNMDYLKELVQASKGQMEAFFAVPLPAGQNVIETDSHTTYETKIEGTVAKHVVKRSTTSVPTGTGMVPSITIDIWSIDTQRKINGAHCLNSENNCQNAPEVVLDYTSATGQTLTYYYKKIGDKFVWIKSTCQEATCERVTSTHRSIKQEQILMTTYKPKPESQDPYMMAGPATQDASLVLAGVVIPQDGSKIEDHSVPAAAGNGAGIADDPLIQAAAVPDSEEPQTSSYAIDENGNTKQSSCIGDKCTDTTGKTTPPGQVAEGSAEEEAAETPEQEAAEKSEGSPVEEASETPDQESAESQGAEGTPEEEAAETPDQESAETQGAEGTAGAEGTPEEEAAETPDQEAAEPQDSEQPQQ